jgi:hypothetical protein
LTTLPRDLEIPAALLAGARQATPDEEVPVWQVADLSDDAYAAALAHAP